MADPVAVSVTVPDLPVVTEVGVAGIQGSPGIFIGDSAPADTDILWADTSEPGDAVVPQGGTAGQVLAKVSSDDYDTGWVDSTVEGTLPVGGTTGQALVKSSNSNYATEWSTISSGIQELGYMNRPSEDRIKIGVPNRQIVWGGTTATYVSGYIYFIPFYLQESITVLGFRSYANAGSSGVTMAVGLYSVSSFANGTTATLVANTTGTMDLAAGGQKDVTLGTPVTITTGRYYIAFLPLGGNTPQMWFNTPQTFVHGAGIQAGTNLQVDNAGRLVALGQASLPATQSNTLQGGLTSVPIHLKW